jgi:hypothetical protein
MEYKQMKVFRTCKMPDNVIKALKIRKLGEGNEHRALPQYFSFYLHEEWKIVEVITNKSWYKEHYIDGGNLDVITGAEILKDVKKDGLRKIIERGHCIISDWLYDNGAKVHEEVIIWDM